MKIVFMGTPEFAVASLAKIYESSHEVVGVVTATDKPGRRGMQLQMSAVKEYALSKNIPVLQPEKLKNPDFLAELKALGADVFVVVAFRMLPEVVWAMPPLGTFNLHASLLPQYRGAAPINWAVIQGEKESGVSTFLLDKEIDTGAILMQEKVAIPEDWNAGDLHDALMEIGSELILKTLDALAEGKIKAMPQVESTELRHAPKIFKETCEISWNQSAESVRNFIRGMAPYPAAWTTLNGKQLKVYLAEVLEEKSDAEAGTFHLDTKKGVLKVACQDYWISLKEVQLEGKKRLHAGDFLRGYTA